MIEWQGTKKYILGMCQREDVVGWKHLRQKQDGSAFGSRFGEGEVAGYVSPALRALREDRQVLTRVEPRITSSL